MSIEWNKYTSDTDLFYITNEIKIYPKKRECGTTLVIDNLKDRWTEAAIKRIYRYVADILQPFPLEENNINQISENITSIDPGFKSLFYIVLKDGSRKRIVDDKIMIYNHATAIIDGSVDKLGKGSYSITSTKLSYELTNTKIGLDAENPDSEFDKIKNIKFRAYYFIYDNDLMPKMHLSAIRKFASTSGGIRLYRNGFRVLPYGELGDDWLSLDSSTRRRSILPVHANVNFFGFVEIRDDSGNFEETSSREGLMENESLIQLKNFIYRTIVSAVINIAETRNVKIVSGQKKDEIGNWERIELRVKNIAYTLDELDKALEDDSGNIIAKTKRRKKIKNLKKEVEEVQKLQQEAAKKLVKDQSMLRVLSSVGLTVGQFVHEIKYYLQNISSDITFIQYNFEVADPLLVKERLSILKSNFETFQSYLSYFDGVISQNVIRDLIPIELRQIVRPFIKSVKQDAEGSKIFFEEPIYNGYFLYTKPMHPSEWSSILFNLYTNAKKAIKKTYNEDVSSGKILIECGLEDNNIYLEFSDTGIGIPEENENKIFEAFFTTTSQNSLSELDQSSDVLGTGLGLKIVSDIVKSYRGVIKVVSPKSDYSTCIRIEIPKATDKELKEYGL